MDIAEYLSPRDLGRAVGLSESSVRRWADDGRLRAERTAGGHRRIARAEAVRFIRETGLELLRPDLLGFPRSEPSRGLASAPEAEALLAALRASDTSAVRRMLVSAFLDGTPLSTLCDGPIRLALREIGFLWREGPAGIVQEKRAVDACLHALMEIRSAIPDRLAAPVALGGAVEGDPYILPSIMTSVVLADVGFRSLNLGPHVPSAALVSAAETYGPLLVWRCASIPGAGRSLRPEVRHFRSLAPDRRPGFIVGGAGFSSADLPRGHGVEHLHSMAELAGFGRALLRGGRV
ncbi:MAG: hypothetical protein P8R42_17045 [Candidatus Binatia bacterium]|nr:hypothetical protein [Candidatus Binatia bacterium]